MTRLHVTSEFGTLRAVLMASPKHFCLVDPINEVQQREFKANPPEVDQLVREQRAFVEILEAHGVAVRWAPEQPRSPFQLNTRDAGAVVGDALLLGRMSHAIRSQEPRAVAEVLEDVTEGELVELAGGVFEGGDLLVDGPNVYIGLGARTDTVGAEQVRAVLEPRGFTVETLPLADGVLHLDVAVTLAAPGVAVAYPPAFPGGLPTSILSRYTVLEVPDDVFQRVGVNVFAIQPGKVVVDGRNQALAAQLRNSGLEVVEIGFTHTTRIGGSFRCMTLPLFREPARY